MSHNQQIAEKLNTLLSSVMVHYQNLRGFHWNVKGQEFFELHEKYEEYYNETALFADAVAERILMIEGKPLHTFADFTANSKIETVSNISDPRSTVEHVINQNQELLELVTEIKKLAGQNDDQGTSHLMETQIGVMEQKRWMLKSWLGK